MKGRLFQLKPGTVIRIVGQPWLQVDIYKPERFRCPLCGRVFTANLLPECNTGSRSDHSAKAIVTLLKYQGGIPFYRQEQIQGVLGAPISASEIWQMTEEVADARHPIYSALLKLAADAELIHNDDTKAKILSRIKDLKEAEKTPNRTGTVTTCILAILNKAIKVSDPIDTSKGLSPNCESDAKEVSSSDRPSENLEEEVKVGLFFTGWKHAGENLADLLDKRGEDLANPIQQCDALSHNIPKNHETQLSNCLPHLRRKFYELVHLWKREVVKIIGFFSCVFVNDDESPKDPEKRLEWHKEKSKPVMDELKKYCDDLIAKKMVEPNSSLGKAIAYLNNHWDAFTLFLSVPGVPLTNNIIERNRTVVYFCPLYL